MIVIEQLKRDEGFVSHIYKCTSGKDTVGYGYNLEANPLNLSAFELKEVRCNGVSEAIANLWLLRMVEDIEEKLSNSLEFFERLSDARKAVLINMAYQMGFSGLLKFKNTLKYLKRGDYALVSENMLNSTWAEQTPKRAQRLARQMSTDIPR